MSKDSQCMEILIHLKEEGPITTKIARELYKCERLAARIHDLRRKEIPIKTDIEEYIDSDGRKVRYAIYSLEANNA